MVPTWAVLIAAVVGFLLAEALGNILEARLLTP